MPRATERTLGMRSVRMRSPPGRSLRSKAGAAAIGPLGTLGRVVAAGRRRRGLALALLGERERDAVLPVDLGDLDEHLVADVDDVLDGPHALALLAQLGDVQQAVLARGERDERPEGGGLHHRAEVTLPHLGHDRVHLLADHLQADVELLAVGRADEHAAVVRDRIHRPEGAWSALIRLPFGPISAPILETGICSTWTRGARRLTCSRGRSMAAWMTSRITMRASRAWVSAPISTSLGMPVSLVSSCSAVTNSRVPATLKSMSPKASSAPRMSVRVTNSPPSEIRPMAMPPTGALMGTPASISDRVEAHTDAIEVEPLDDSTSETSRSA